MEAEAIIQFLATASEQFRACQDISQGYIPSELVEYLQCLVRDHSLREEVGSREATWREVAGCFKSVHSLEDNSTCARYLNGLLLLGRNALCTERAHDLAWTEGAVQQIILLYVKLLERNDLNSYQERIMISTSQFLANFASAGAKHSTFQILLSNFSATACRSFCRELSAEAGHALMIFSSKSLSSKNGIECLSGSETGRTIFREFLTLAEVWFSDDKYQSNSAILIDIFTLIVKTGYTTQVLETFTLENISSGQRLSMLKLLDAGIHSSLEPRDQITLTSHDILNLLQSYKQEFELASTSSLPFINARDTDPEYSQGIQLEISNIWNNLVVVLDSLHSLVDLVQYDNYLSAKKQFLQTNIIEKLVTLLGAAQDYLPRRSKLSDLKKATGNSSSATDGKFDISIASEDYNPQDFPLIKVKIISILAVLTQGEKAVQDEIRERHGLELVLSNCMIDLNNPYIRETSILCVRYLLQGNEANQMFISKLEAKETVTEDALVEAGFETTLIDGKVALKAKQQKK